MRVLLDTNIVIHREAATVNRSDIGFLFQWLDRLRYTKCVHPLTIEEIRQHGDSRVVSTFLNKLNSYHTLQTTAHDTPGITAIRASFDRDTNDAIDSSLLNELANDRVEFFITEDRKIHSKASTLDLTHRIFTIDGFLEKVTAENPEFVDYKVLSVRREFFGNIRLDDPFFDSFRADYPDFDRWFNTKADEHAYFCADESGAIVAFLYLKMEGSEENYFDIFPAFRPKRRLKIGSFKVSSNGFKIGERFVKIVFDNAVRFRVDEIYVTLFDHDDSKLRLVNLLSDWGFNRHGEKRGEAGAESVLIRHCSVESASNADTPRIVFPYAKVGARKFVVPIYPQYHTELLPDSVLRTESLDDFIDNAPNRNALSKVYISRSIERDLEPGDLIVFYRTASGGHAWYTSVATTIGVVESVITNIRGEQEFIEICRKRSVFSDKELAEHWNRNRRNRPFVVNFLYLYSFPKRLNRKELIEREILGEEPPRGFVQISDEQFNKLLEGSDVDRRIIVD